MEYDSVLDQKSISGENVSLILCVWNRAETDSNFYYPDILNKTYPDILRIVTSSLAIETFYSLL